MPAIRSKTVSQLILISIRWLWSRTCLRVLAFLDDPESVAITIDPRPA